MTFLCHTDRQQFWWRDNSLHY